MAGEFGAHEINPHNSFEMTVQQTTAPEGVTRIVVFDTNAYRNLTFGLSTDSSRKKARKLADTELSRGTKALANPFIIWELVSHLADPTDPAFENCMNSLVALVEHTRKPDDDLGGVCRIADGETEICRQLFNRIPSIAEQNCANLSKLASYVWSNAPSLADSNAQTNFKVFGAEMDKKEAAWLDHVEALLTAFRSLDSSFSTAESKKNEIKKRREHINGPAFLRQTALGKAISCASLFDFVLSEDELKEAGDRMERIFPTSLKLMQKTLAGWFDAPDMNLRSPKKKRGNFVWDTALCYGIGADHSVGEAKILFVTDDEAVLNGAGEAGCGDRVMKFQDYLMEILPTGS